MLSSHQLQQVQQICSRVGIIVKGKLIVQGEMDTLGKAILKGREWNFLLEVSGNADGLERELQSIRGVDEIETAAARLVSPLHRRRSPRSRVRGDTPGSAACSSSAPKIRLWKRSI